MWAGAEPAELTAVWAEHLAGMRGEDIKSALEALQLSFADWPPTLFEFAGLCRDAQRRRTDTALKLCGPKTAMPAAIREQLRQYVRSHKVVQ